MGKRSIYGPVYSLAYDVTVKGDKIKRRMTLSKFIEKNSKGTFIVCVKKHAFTIKNGVVIGNEEDSTQKRKIINSAWKIGA